MTSVFFIKAAINISPKKIDEEKVSLGIFKIITVIFSDNDFSTR